MRLTNNNLKLYNNKIDIDIIKILLIARDRNIKSTEILFNISDDIFIGIANTRLTIELTLRHEYRISRCSYCKASRSNE